MQDFLKNEKSFKTIKELLTGRNTVLSTDLEGGAKSFVIWTLNRTLNKQMLLIVPGPQEAQELFEDLLQYDGEKVLHFPAQEVLPHEKIPADISLCRERQEVLEKLAFQEDDYVVITCVQALLQGVVPPDAYKSGALELEKGTLFSQDHLIRRLFQAGYERVHQVENQGQYAQRGGIVDIFPLTFDQPLRVEYFGDEIDSLRWFDVATQRSLEKINRVVVPPAGENYYSVELLNQGKKRIRADLDKAQQQLKKDGKDKEAKELYERVQDDLQILSKGNLKEGLGQYLPYIYGEMTSILDYLHEPVVVFNYPEFINSRARNFSLEMGETQVSLLEQGSILPGYQRCFHDLNDILLDLISCPVLLLGQSPPDEWDLFVSREVEVPCGAVPSFNGRLDEFASRVKQEIEEGYRVVVSMNTRARCEKIAQYLHEKGIEYTIHTQGQGKFAAGLVNLIISTISEGFFLGTAGLVLHTEKEILGKQKIRKKKVQDLQEGMQISSLNELEPGDYVVHENHGIGRYLGIRTEEVLGVHQDYLVIKYAGEDRLYVPTHQVHLIQKYIGVEEQPPRLYRLGGGEWNRVKKKVKESVQEMAVGLLKLYARRQAVEGYSFSPDMVWQKDFESTFPYEETPDQEKAIHDIKNDMEDSKPMDRLLCGDVGYGKTEVAIRASFKAVMDGKQVALLVPTTILAQQHYNTFKERFEDYPINLEMLSRFRNPRQQKEIIKKVRRGDVDIVIGTHRLLSQDVTFFDLGLLIVDEEQRFGVVHKERLKELKSNVDVLTLTATPIPRTLHMAMVGVRNMSLIETPPQDRYPIRTYVREYNRDLIRDAIRREMARDGQVYFVHNRVEDIRERAREIQELVPEARIVIAHGQMPEAQLEKLMLNFFQGEYDVLVCTTIIETGMDITNVNTIIVNNADHMGLAQLYQLRGRVGRSNRVAYAYLLYKQDKALSETSEKRLQAIKEFTSLGSGFKLAMRDLEIRGAGNLLGPEQHGHIAAVGFSLYCKLLEETVNELTGQEKETRTEDIVVDTDWDAYIPENYIPDTRQKIEIYKKISRIKSEEDRQDLYEEILDRFGDPPRPVLNLLQIARLRVLAQEKGLKELKLKGQKGEILLTPTPSLGDKVVALGEKYNRRLRVRGSRNPKLFINLNGLQEKEARDILEDVLVNL